MDVTKERISRILELREILLSIQTGFSLVNAAVACAVLQSNSGLEPSSVITEPRTWSLWLCQASVHSLWSLCRCHWCCLSSAWSSRHWFPCRRLWRLCQDAQLNLPVLLPLLLSHQCHQQSGDWWLFRLQCWQVILVITFTSTIKSKMKVENDGTVSNWETQYNSTTPVQTIPATCTVATFLYTAS